MIDPSGFQPCFFANPDVSGIGVRTAIYAQNLLSFGPAILALWDGKVTLTELDALEKQSTTILITAFAILVSTIVQAQTGGISNYHASIVLDLSWMNNTNLFIYLLLHAHHRANLSDKFLEEESQGHLKSGTQKLARWIYEAKKIVSNPVIIIGTLHLSLMAAVGVWLWSNPSHFGSSQFPCSLSASVVVVGKQVPLGSDGLKAWSILVYSALLIPFFNLIIPMALFAIPLWFFYRSTKHIGRKPIMIGLIMLGIIDAILLVDTEVGIGKNTEHGLLQKDEGQWTFGQTLALLLLLIPLRDLGESVWERQAKVLGRQMKEAARKGQEEVVNYLLELGPSKEAIDASFKEACKEHHFGIVKRLAQIGANVNYQTEDDSPLYIGPQCENLAIFKFLVETCKTSDNVQEVYKDAPLILGVKSGNLDVVRYLVETCKADVHAQNAYTLWTPLHYGAYIGNLEIVRYLVETCKANANARNNRKMTPLHIGAKSGYLEIVKYLVETGKADANAQNKNQYTPLHFGAQSGNLDIIKYLVETGKADVNAQNKYNETPLHISAQFGNLKIVRYLVETCKADIHIQKYNGTPLHTSAEFGNLDIVKYLIETCKADVNVQNIYKDTPLSYGAQSGNLDIVKYLVETCKADIHVKGNKKLCHFGATSGNLNVVRYLVETCKADVHVKDNYQRTPLHYAAKSGNLDLVRYLVKTCKAHVHVQDIENWTPLCLSKQSKNLNVVRYLWWHVNCPWSRQPSTCQ